MRHGRAGNVESRAVHNRLNSRAVAGAMRKPSALRNPNARAHVAAAAALAGWHHRDRRGWWRHRHGGYGWVGPLFWPFAFYDIYGYTFWGDGYDPAFWDYGYDDIYAGLFAPYGYDDLTGYLPSRRGGGGGGGSAPAAGAQAPQTSSPAPDSDNQLALMCGEDARNIAGLPIDRIQQAIQPNDAQRAALDELANASTDAAQKLRAACPTEVALTAPNRLAAMQTRIEAMIAAVHAIQPPLDKFYGLLDDEQKARINAIVGGRRGAPGEVADCSPGTPLQWPAEQIEKTLNPTEAQRASLTALQDATAKAADMLKASCAPSGDLTPPARLAAIGTRLETLDEAVKTVHAALTDFYGQLTDEQKAQFEAIGPGLNPGLSTSASSDRSGRARTSHRRHGYNVERMIRRMISIGL
jgi:hypothetical protein